MKLLICAGLRPQTGFRTETSLLLPDFDVWECGSDPSIDVEDQFHVTYPRVPKELTP